MPKSTVMVLIAAKKVAEKTSIFNFEAVYKCYTNFNNKREG